MPSEIPAITGLALSAPPGQGTRPSPPQNRRAFLRRSAVGCAGLVLCQSPLWLPGEPPGEALGPVLSFEDPALEALHSVVFRNALHNLLVTNTVRDAKKEYNRTGLFLDPPGCFLRAGGDYATPWTRDASINSWNAASLLAPAVAQNTLWAVCERRANGKLMVQRDNQWWDKVIWVNAAWTHFLVTGDRGFLALAYETAAEAIQELRQTRFNARLGLHEGPSVLCDGIAGYPEPPYDPGVASSFILDHPGGDKVMCLSTNCVHYQAYRCAAWMAGQLGRPAAEIQRHQSAAEQLRAAIQHRFWMPQKSTYGYFIHGAGPRQGLLDESQEAMGLAFAILFEVASPKQIRSLLKTVHIEPKGLVCVWPHFARFNEERPGRHNVMVWPMASGLWAHACAKAGAAELFQKELTNLATLVQASQGIFYEIYHSIHGRPDGGWQVGKHWSSCVHQTWSATAYLRMVLHGLFGINLEPDGLRFTPTLPGQWGAAQLRGLKYRNMILDVRLSGQGRRLARVEFDRKKLRTAWVPASWTGPHELAIQLKT
jgi:glycogen debranching enzyme